MMKSIAIISLLTTAVLAQSSVRVFFVSLRQELTDFCLLVVVGIGSHIDSESAHSYRN